MNKYVKELVELSNIDKSLNSFNPRIEAINKKIEKEQKKSQDLSGSIAKLQQHIAENKDKIATYEEQITSLNEKLNEIKKKSNEVTNEKEINALTVEENITKEKIAFANEEIERLNKVIEAKESEILKLQEELDAQNSILEQVQKSSEDEITDIEKQKQELFKLREKIVHEIDQKVLAFYEKIRKWARDTAVVPIKKHACYGCFLKVSDKTYSDVLKGDEIVTCPHCDRILYIELEDMKEEEA